MKKLTLIILGLFLTIGLRAQTSVTTDSITQLSFCPGDDVFITFKTTGMFPLTNKFIAQISNNFGQFTKPVEIGNTRFSVFGNGLILAKLPTNAAPGFLYRIRVVSTNPKDTSVSPTLITIISAPPLLNQIIPVCQNDTVTLASSVPGMAYLWSTGATTQSIVARDTGAYSVTITDPLLKCKSTAYDTIQNTVTCNGLLSIDESDTNFDFSVFPNPNNGQFSINMNSGNNVSLVSLNVMDVLGKDVYSLSAAVNNSNYTGQFDLSNLSPGIYVVKMDIDSVIKTRRIIIE